MADEWQRLATYGSKVEADLASARLDQAGIPSRVQTDDAGGAYPVLQTHGSHLLVATEDRARAEEVLAEAIEAPRSEESETVLEAAEEAVAHPEGARRSRFGSAARLLLACVVIAVLFTLLTR